jgi:hypothetical protein
MKILTISIMLTVAFCLMGCEPVSKKESYLRKGYDFTEIDHVAVVDVVGDIYSEVVKKQIADFFTARLLEKGFGPVVRDYVQHELRLNNFQGDDLTDESYAIEAGRTIEAPAVFIISVPSFGDEMIITAKMIEVEAGSALWFGHASNSAEQSKKKSRFSKKDKEPAYQTQDEFGDIYVPQQTPQPRQELTDQQRLERPLTLEDEARVQDLINEICSTLPHRSTILPAPPAPLPVVAPAPQAPSFWEKIVSSPEPQPAPVVAVPVQPTAPLREIAPPSRLHESRPIMVPPTIPERLVDIAPPTPPRDTLLDMAPPRPMYEPEAKAKPEQKPKPKKKPKKKFNWRDLL